MHKPTLRAIASALISLFGPRIKARPARNIVTRRGKNSRGYFPSRKASAPLKYESQLELMAFRALEIASIPRALSSQPARLTIKHGGHAFRYTPDICFKTPWRETIFVEVKPDRKFLDAKTTERLRAVTEALIEEGTQLVVLLESDLKPDPGFHDVLERLLRQRPWRKPSPSAAQADLPPDNADECETNADWQQARAACDALIKRVMARDFLQTVAAAEASLEV